MLEFCAWTINFSHLKIADTSCLARAKKNTAAETIINMAANRGIFDVLAS
jgi:hypothetical protein